MNEQNDKPAADFVEMGFMDARAKVIDVAAFLDRVQRAGQEDDHRVRELKKVLSELSGDEPNRAKRVLLGLSDPTDEPIPAAPGKGAAGAWDGPSA